MEEKVIQSTGKYHLIVGWDDLAEDPRRLGDNLGIMACFHKRYSLGDKHHGICNSDFCSWEEMKEHIESKQKAVVILPIYMYDHSGQTISTQAFSCPWDSGQIGYIFTTKERIREWFCKKRITPALIARATAVLENEIHEYDAWMNGNVCMWQINDDKEEVVDSCGGYYIVDDAITDGRCTLERIANENQTGIC